MTDLSKKEKNALSIRTNRDALRRLTKGEIKTDVKEVDPMKFLSELVETTSREQAEAVRRHVAEDTLKFSRYNEERMKYLIPAIFATPLRSERHALMSAKWFAIYLLGTCVVAGVLVGSALAVSSKITGGSRTATPSFFSPTTYR